jgi:thiol-disulfide isomerase/thioredoxin
MLLVVEQKSPGACENRTADPCEPFVSNIAGSGRLQSKTVIAGPTMMLHPLLLSPFALFVSSVARLGPRHTTSYPFVISSSRSSSRSSAATVTTTKMQAFSLADSAAVLMDDNGETLLQGEALAQRLHHKQVALYFAAGWCPMCTRFEPALLQFRETTSTPVEIIYVSSDRTATDHAKRVAGLHMLSIPFGTAAELKQRYRIWSGMESGTFGTGRRSGVPALVVLLDRDGDELAFLAAESKGAAALRDWPLDDPRAVWGG